MNEMQAALGLLQLKHHEENIEKRRQIAVKYKTHLEQIKCISLLSKHSNLETKQTEQITSLIKEFAL